MTESGVQLVTPLMQFGSLLHYLHTKKNLIPTNLLLTWCQQIAEVGVIDRLIREWMQFVIMTD